MFNDILESLSIKTFDLIKDHSPTVLAIATGVGVIATAITSGKAAIAAEEIKTEYAFENAEENEDGSYIVNDDISLWESFKLTWPCFVKPMAIGALTIYCAYKSDSIHREREKALTAMYIGLREYCDKYIQFIKERYGEDVHRDIENQIHIEKNPNLYYTCGAFVDGENEAVDLDDEVKRLFYDNFSGKLFECTMAKILDAENNMNRMMLEGRFVTLKDFYSLLGLTDFSDCPPWKINEYELETLGWLRTKSCIWLDFDHQIINMDILSSEGLNPLQAIMITYDREPMPLAYYKN